MKYARNQFVLICLLVQLSTSTFTRIRELKIPDALSIAVMVVLEQFVSAKPERKSLLPKQTNLRMLI